MATKRIIADQDFEQLIIRTHRGMRNVTMRVKPDGLYLTVPPFSKTAEVLKILEPYRLALLEKYEEIRSRPIDLNFHIDAPCFKLSLRQGTLSFFSIRFEEEQVTIFCPYKVDFAQEDIQRLVRNAIVRALKKRAEEYLLPLLQTLADQYHFIYRKVRIKAVKSRWGSCSTAGSINLSCYLLLLPPHLMDYVLLHELCHTKEMNHGPKFWELLDDVTSGMARALRKELRHYRAGFLFS